MEPIQPSRRVPSHYAGSIADFLREDTNRILGVLATANTGALDSTQRDAWLMEIAILKRSLTGIEGTLYLEFEIPRLASRVDAVLLSGAALIPIEFKCGERAFTRRGYNQVWDYALDFKNFHQASHSVAIFPILVATDAAAGDAEWHPPSADGVRPPRRANDDNLVVAVRDAVTLATGGPIDAESWGPSPYRPTPTIIEAARALYSRHSVVAISRNEAGATNLSVTSVAVEEIATRAKDRGEKAIVFVTGVPGAGKTLVGLDVATRRRNQNVDHAVYLSGNAPLLAVLHEALTVDELARRGAGTRKGDVKQEVQAFIQNIHRFRDDGLRDPLLPPNDRIVIFDEAQRAWNHRKTATWMKTKKNVTGFTNSESEYLISYLQRHAGWAVIVCLVGGGQEIHDGEAGIAAWLEAVRDTGGEWTAYASPHLHDTEYSAGTILATLGDRVVEDPRLHLATSIRSFRADTVSVFVKALLEGESAQARESFSSLADRYPIVVTRGLDRAKQWVRERARGSERFGLVASSNAQRLRPHAIDVRVNVNPVHWFLADDTDVRSSNHLEDAATEFQVQGLELDWACVTWDADLRHRSGKWQHHAFSGSSWKQVRAKDRQSYLVNAYRVLLTRARQGMAIFVPPGDSSDGTRDPHFYDETFSYLAGLGIPTL